MQNQEAIEGSTVTASKVTDGATTNTTTNAEGYFSLTLSFGVYSIVVSAAEYSDNTASEVEISDEGDGKIEVSFALPKATLTGNYCSLVGNVKDTNGNLLNDVLITVDGGAITNGVFTSTQTNNFGNFFVFGVPLQVEGQNLEKVTVRASKPGYSTSAQIVDLSANETIAGINFTLSEVDEDEKIVDTVFSDDFSTDQGWQTTGFWHRQNNLEDIYNQAVPEYVALPPGDTTGGRIPYAFKGNFTYWYGEAETGNFMGEQSAWDYPDSGGTSTSANSGTLTSPPINLGNLTYPAVMFWTWFEIESVNPNQHGYDIMEISVSNDGGTSFQTLRRLNPFSDPPEPDRSNKPYTTGGFNVPANWIPVELDLSDFPGQEIKIRFEFRTVDSLYNGFRGWFIDDFRVVGLDQPVAAQNYILPDQFGTPSR